MFTRQSITHYQTSYPNVHSIKIQLCWYGKHMFPCLFQVTISNFQTMLVGSGALFLQVSQQPQFMLQYGRSENLGDHTFRKYHVRTSTLSNFECISYCMSWTTVVTGDASIEVQNTHLSREWWYQSVPFIPLFYIIEYLSLICCCKKDLFWYYFLLLLYSYLLLLN